MRKICAVTKVGNLATALGCQFQSRCVETQMSDFSFGLVSRLLKNRFQFRFQFCLRTASVSRFYLNRFQINENLIVDCKNL